MIFMITGGLLIRNLHLLPGIAIGVIYSGIGFSLAGAGILFLKRFASTAGTNNKKGVENLIMKKYINISFIYAIAALFSGVFYREFTKAFAFTGKTTLAFTHLHFFALGTIMFLLVAIFSCITNLSEQKQFKHFMRFYNVGLPFVVTMFYVRGITQVLGTELSKGMSAAISGISGIAHIIMTVGIVMLFLALRNSQAIKRLE
ncbi:DUF2871 domain-containing protein [Clostridium swellfunianum]|uniref:DUF2871 domain-containing protein n=1 Tax=Clostridium swellfunianum TaxID=1367462 RepID=UPI00202DE18D|nr:DUF2871 domain-containing protein [Clostridium swellfunianum]MCM0647722.1 DUF2871 domain-containing protein [Clostridium swellfunianum]